MNAIQERWHRTVRAELLDRTPVWNLDHLRRVLTEYELHHNEHRPHRALNHAAPLRPLPDNVINLDHFRVTRRDRISGILHEYHLVASPAWMDFSAPSTPPTSRHSDPLLGVASDNVS